MSNIQVGNEYVLRPTTSKWEELLNNFQLDIAWKMVELDQFEINFFDNIEINGELMTHIVAPVFRMGVDQNQEKFQNFVASQERRRVDQDPNNDCAHVRQKTDLIITLPTGPALYVKFQEDFQQDAQKKYG
nr:2345_t:CDS:2 [Entrophospora candida]